MKEIIFVDKTLNVHYFHIFWVNSVLHYLSGYLVRVCTFNNPILSHAWLLASLISQKVSLLPFSHLLVWRFEEKKRKKLCISLLLLLKFNFDLLATNHCISMTHLSWYVNPEHLIKLHLSRFSCLHLQSCIHEYYFWIRNLVIDTLYADLSFLYLSTHLLLTFSSKTLFLKNKKLFFELLKVLTRLFALTHT